MLKVAIIGAGFAGLATAWHLCQTGKTEITVFDNLGVGGGASGIAAGLLHPFGGPRAKLNIRGLEGMEATSELLQIASKELGISVAKRSGLYRIATNPEQEKYFRETAQLHPDTEITSYDGKTVLSIPQTMTVDSLLYLQGLWNACEKKGVSLVKQKIESIESLQTFDKIILAAGASSKYFTETEHLHLRSLKGQILEVTAPKSYQNIVTPMTTESYLLPNPENKTFTIGATFEREFLSPEPDMEHAVKALLPEVIRYFPDFEVAKVLTCRAGLRATSKNHLPYCCQLSDKCWLATGLGSKGLLYHALLGKDMSRKVLE